MDEVLSQQIPLQLKETAVLRGILEPHDAGPSLTDPQIENALRDPVWPGGTGPSVFDLVRPGESVCLVVSDHTRKTATHRILPILLKGLTERGCRTRDMHILVATGIHRHPTDDEMRAILGPQYFAEFSGRLHFHDPDDPVMLAEVGSTPRGNTVRVNRRAVEAQRLVLLGTATYHYHAGFGGGRKSLVPGLAARETIALNHSLTIDPGEDRIHPMAAPGLLDGNPVAEEMLAGARLCDPDIIINTVLTPSGEPAGVYSGDLDLAHRAACRLVQRIFRVDIDQPADLILAWCRGGGNWIQCHKALVNADRAVQPNGRIILVAPCREGLGNERFRYWVRKHNPRDMYRELRRSPEVNGQTALSTLERGRRAVLVSEMSVPDSDDLGIERARDLDEAATLALAALRFEGITQPTLYVMPQARHTVPFTGQSRSHAE